MNMIWRPYTLSYIYVQIGYICSWI